MEYYGVIKKQKLWVKLMVIVFGIYIIYNAVLNKNWMYIPFGLIMILATFSNKKHIISEKGIDILYIICGFKFHNIWTYEEINKIYIDSGKSKSYIELHIGKDLTFRRFILSAEDTLKALENISKINSNILIKEINARNK